MHSRAILRRKSLHEISEEDDASTDSKSNSPMYGRNDELSRSMKIKIFGSSELLPGDSPSASVGKQNVYPRSWSNCDPNSPYQYGSPASAFDGETPKNGSSETPIKVKEAKKFFQSNTPEHVGTGHPMLNQVKRKRSAVAILNETASAQAVLTRKVLMPNGVEQAKLILFNDRVHGYVKRKENTHYGVRREQHK